jgi:ABC-2 type transport system ATP-binding protein
MSGTGYVYYTGRLAGMSHGDAMQRTHEVLDYVALDEARYRPTEGFSTGMKQRLKLAQALVHDPDLIFLDEPTNGMDPQGRQIMLSLISDLGRAGVSVVLSSHLLPDVQRVCQRVIIMGGGEILKEGVLSDLNTPHPTKCTVEYTGNSDSFCNALTQRNVAVLQSRNGHMDIELSQPDSQMVVVEAAQQVGARLTGLRPKRSSLEETFLEAIKRQQN